MIENASKRNFEKIGDHRRRAVNTGNDSPLPNTLSENKFLSKELGLFGVFSFCVIFFMVDTWSISLSQLAWNGDKSQYSGCGGNGRRRGVQQVSQLLVDLNLWPQK